MGVGLSHCRFYLIRRSANRGVRVKIKPLEDRERTKIAD